MKTVEQAAKEHADKKYPKIGLNEDWKDDGFDEGYDAAMHNKSIEEFKAGVEFAQRFIPIEEELPENEGQYIMLRSNGKYCMTYFQKGNDSFVNYFSDTHYFTHWRPVFFIMNHNDRKYRR